MFDIWTTDLTDEEATSLVDRAASEIHKRGLEVPAAFFLQSHRQWGFMASQGAIVFSPFLVPFFGIDTVSGYSRLLADQKNIDRLLERLESKPLPTQEESCTST